jgi:hypothetical protein
MSTSSSSSTTARVEHELHIAVGELRGLRNSAGRFQQEASKRLDGVQREIHQLLASHHHHDILGTSSTSFGAALIVLGAVMVLARQLLWEHQTFDGSQPTWEARLLNGLAFGGDILIGVGSIVLAAAGGESFEAVAVVVGLAVVLVLSLMGHQLRKYLNDDVRVDAGEVARRSWLWCFFHPLAKRELPASQQSR